jgi:hypothetical protein
MPSQDIVGPDQNQASPLAAMPEAEEHAKAKAELSELLRQIDQTKAEADDARTLVKRLGDKARRVADRYVEPISTRRKGRSRGRIIGLRRPSSRSINRMSLTSPSSERVPCSPR